MRRTLVAAMALSSLAACGSSSGDGYGARDACRDWVRQQLVSPSTAKFSSESGYQADTGPWLITGTVDSQNSFGAMLRSTWTCTVHKTGSDSTTTTFDGNATVSPE